MYKNFYMNTKKFPFINPLFIGEESCRSNHSFGPAARDYYILHFVVSGNGYFQNEQNEYYLKEDDCFVIRPNETTFYKADSKNPWHYIWIAFDETYLIPNTVRNGGVIRNPALRNLFLSLPKIHLKDNPGECLCGKTMELFQLLQENKEANSYVRQAIMIMENNIANVVSISEISKQLHINRSYFSTLFKNETGVSAQEYYLKLRLDQVEMLLRDYELSVGEAAHYTGFESLSNFSRMYKKYKNISPSVYKKK